ncbi:MAG: hypothetical protein ACN6PE_23140 [Achromobacter marplatensis]|uniref:hypothetical protein n=1 Tax=Achromobacter marplatensis TaxID=470868 RepID=UPI003D0875A3
MNNSDTSIAFDSSLYDPVSGEPTFDTFSACLNARGVYESQRFALRLSPAVHELVNSAVEKSEAGDANFTGEELQAYSTYIHETVHWWQHKGSTSGFIRSILYPVQTHSNLPHLRQVATALGPQKPIRFVALNGELGLLPPGSTEVGYAANTATNNFMDTEFYLALTFKPTLDVEIYEDPYFMAAGHSFLITYGLVLGAIRELIDKDGSLFPDPQVLGDNLTALAKRKVRGYYYGSQIIRAPVGVLHLYEGQARFIQLQFLALSCDGLSVAEAKARGMLDGVYGEAFREFLKLSESPEPEGLLDPLIALFLFICDMAINPTVGFPAPIEVYEDFFLDADPGIRFAILCRAVATDAPELRTFVTEYSSDEYRILAERLGEATGLGSHIADLTRLKAHASAHQDAAGLLDEHRSFKFVPDNIVLRVLTGEFLTFVTDRVEAPEFFCWTGYWLTHGSGQRQRELWLKHLSLFSDTADDGALFARMVSGRDEADVLEVFNQFFGAIILYDLSKQWVLSPGQFRLDYSWLTSTDSPDFMDRVKGVFYKNYGVELDKFELLDRPFVPK